MTLCPLVSLGIACAIQTSETGVRAIPSEARREEAVGPIPTTTSRAVSDERVRAKTPRFGWRRLMLLWGILAILGSGAGAMAAESLHVVASIKPVHAFLAGLMKDADTPELLIGGRSTPYDFQPDGGTLGRLNHADVVVWVGPELEASLTQPLRELKKRRGDKVRVVELLSSPTLKILPSRKIPGQRDPFFWLDDRNAIILLDELTELLVEVDPRRAHIYTRNRREMLKPLRHLDREYEYGYRGLKAGRGVTYYDTLQYFEQAYALKLLDEVAASPRQPVDTAALLRVRARLVAGDANCVLVEKGMPARQLGLLTQGLNVNIGELDSLGVDLEPGSGLYLHLMEHNTDAIKRCLGADMSQAASAREAARGDDASIQDGIGGRFVLTDQYGDTRTEQDFRGHYSLVYFGYTYCPDVCPTSLQVMTSAMRLLGDKAKRFQPYFISIDPDRDTVKTLHDYVKYFDPRLVGLTGSKAMLKRVASEFRVKFEKGEVDPEHPDMYLMDHSASLYLMGPDGRFITKFAYGIDAPTLVKQLNEIVP